MLVANQVARLSSLVEVVILSEKFAPGIDLSSSVVRDVLRGWIAHGDVAGVLMTLLFATGFAKPHESTAGCLLEACQQAGDIGCFAGLSDNLTCQALVKCAHRHRHQDQHQHQHQHRRQQQLFESRIWLS